MPPTPKPPTIAHSLTVTGLTDDGFGIAMHHERVWHILNALPHEVVDAELITKRNGVRIARAIAIISPSPHRIPPCEEHFLSCSPWQIMARDYELSLKQSRAREIFSSLSLPLPAHDPIPLITSPEEYGYRNKMEFSFYGDANEHVSLSLFKRKSRGKYPLMSCVLADPTINTAAQRIVQHINDRGIKARQLKTVILRSTRKGDLYAALFVKDEALTAEDFSAITLPNLDVYFSDPKSPASLPTRSIFTRGHDLLTESVLGHNISFHGLGFFQVNVPVFEEALRAIRPYVVGSDVLDFYSGAGTISLALQDAVRHSLMVEQDAYGAQYTTDNIAAHQLADRMMSVHAAAESIVSHITSERVLIVDPPRAGLHTHVITRILDALPPTVVYLSCNPTTQARDCLALSSYYHIQEVSLFDFFPRTPHFESLMILVRR